MTNLLVPLSTAAPLVSWEPLPIDFPLPDEPVENNFQPLLAAALRESLELAGLILESVLIAANFGICATVNEKTVVKAPDWVYIPSVKPLPLGEIRRSYTPCTEGDRPSIAIEFISASDGGEYSFNPHYPYGKWYFYEQILTVPTYAIFHPQLQVLEVYRLVDGRYQPASPDENQRVWIEEIGLFLGTWNGRKADFEGCWLRWWDEAGNLLLWGGELLQQERQLAEQERERAEQVEQKNLRLAAKLKEMGIETEEI